MTNDEISAFLNVLRGRGSNPATVQAANLIEQLQRERDEARDRLAQAERDSEKWSKDAVLMCGLAEILSEHGLIPSSSELLEARDRALAKSRDAGFRAGIEAAADVCSVEKDANEIIAITPSDKPAAPSVGEAFEMGQRDMLERAANLVQTFLDDGSIAVADDLRNLLEIRALAARECD